MDIVLKIEKTQEQIIKTEDIKASLNIKKDNKVEREDREER